jgi:AcrR family transcriptional regulator
VSTPYEAAGRVNQKQRTRDALVVAARDLVSRGASPTVEQAAAAAGISRTTAYRYFPTQRALLASAHPETARTTLLPADPPDDPAARLEAAVDAFLKLITQTEAQQRMMLRLSLEATPEERAALPLRQGRAIAWFEEALAPLRGRLTDAEITRLVHAVRTATGIESLVWLVDVAGLSRKQAHEQMRWTARSLLAHVLAT